MQEKVSQEQRASIAWTILTNIAKNKKKIRYKELADEVGVHHRVARFFLGLIQDYCLENQLPPLTILVVNQTGFPGKGFIAWDINNFEDGIQKVYGFNWDSIPNPFGYAESGTTQDELVQELLNNPDLSGDIYATVKIRGAAQPIFRKALLKAYNHTCAICGITRKHVLEATHIVPWSECSGKERLDIRNGILLCANHHKLFDAKIITLNDDFTINYYDPDGLKGDYSEYDKLFTINLHKKKINLPKDIKYYPDLKYIRAHIAGRKTKNRSK